ncbi:MAG: c-type cytochrome domain-containing protein, partial [Rubripirellula sp.]
MMIRAFLTVGLLLGFSLSVRAEQKTDETPKINFTDHVLPIFREHCLKCHNANDAEAGLAIDSYGALMEGGGSGDAVSNGDASASRLYLVMTHAEEPAMPPNQEPIAKEKLEIIRKWIEGGLLENSGSKAKKRKGPSLTFTSMEGGKPAEIVMPESVWRVPVVTSQRAAAASAIAASPWAPLVAIAGQKQVTLYNTESGDLEGIIPFPEGIPQVLQFSVDGGYLMVAGGTHSSKGVVSLYNVKTGDRLLSVGDELDTVFGADVNNDLSKVALGGPQKLVRIFDSGTGDALFELNKHTDWVYCVDFSPDG